jgi:SAM-dependent methyltransferase
MSAPVIDQTRIDQPKLESLLARAVGDLSAGYGGVLVSLGAKLGLYQAMADAGPLSPAELAARAGCAEPYVREWLNAQAAGGYVDYHAGSGTYELSPEQALVLADADSPAYLPHAWQIPAALWADEAKAAAAFRTGGGVAWGEHDARLHEGVAAFYRNAYRASLVAEWLPALDGVVGRLEAGIAVADVGCGHGHSALLLAAAFPRSRVSGFDLHAPSIEAARRHAAEAGLAERVAFEVAGATDYPGRDYGLICFFDCLHDLGDPVGAARRAYEALAEDGTLMVVEPFAGDSLTDNLGPIGQLYYTGSALLCVPHSRSEAVGLALGAQAGPARLEAVFREAGFTSIRTAYQSPFNIVLEVRR